MAKKMLESLRNSKTRTLAVFGIVLFVIVIIIVYFSVRKPDPLQTEASRTSKVPQITSVPGNVTSEKYRELQEEDNRRRAEIAKKSGGSAVATIIGSRDKIAQAEGFGIEGGVACKCPGEATPSETPTLDVATASRLIAEIEKNPKDALRLLRANPGLAKALCAQKPDLALKIIESDKESAKIILMECPALVKLLAEKNPALLKQLLLDNCDLAKKVAETNAAVLKNLLLTDASFAQKLALSCPDAVKNLMKNDPDFADKMATTYPDVVKDLMKNDPDFARIMAKNNPGFVKKFMLTDPEFAKTMAANNPDMIKELMKNDPAFAEALAKSDPTLVKELMKNDPAFATLMADQNAAMVKQLMLNDPEFAKVMARNNPAMVNKLMKDDPAFSKALLDRNPGIDKLLEAGIRDQPILSDNQRAQALAEARRRQQEDQAKRALQVQLNDQQQKQIAALLTNMEAQSKAAFVAWNEVIPQAFIQGESGDKNGGNGEGDGTGEGGGNGSSEGPGPLLFKAGTVYFAVLDTAVNTDEPGPIMATIVQGPYKGAKLLGDMQTVNIPGAGGNRPEKVVLNFSLLSAPQFPTSIPIKAVAIDPDTARTAMATDVDRHILLRYGTLLASSFMTGYAKVITSAGTVQTSNNASGATVTVMPILSPRQQIFAALGDVGKKFGEATQNYFNTPNTITVDSGTGFGLLFLTDVSQGK